MIDTGAVVVDFIRGNIEEGRQLGRGSLDAVAEPDCLDRGAAEVAQTSGAIGLT